MLQPLLDPTKRFFDQAVIPPSYVISKIGDKYYAKNGETGEIEFSGTDASSVIQSAIDALPADGGKIFIKAGTYELKNGLVINKDKVELEGEGKSSTLRVADGANLTVPIIRVGNGITAREHISIHDLQIDGNRAGQTAGEKAHGIHLNRVRKSCICRCYIKSTFPRIHGGGDGIWIDVPSSIKISDNSFYDVGDRGITVMGEEGADTFAGIIIVNNLFKAGFDRSISVECPTLGKYLYDVIIVGNVCDGNAEGSGIGLDKIRNFVVEGNLCINNARRGLYIKSECYDGLVVGNSFRKNGYAGIQLDPMTSRISLVANNIEENTWDGIYVYNFSGYGYHSIIGNRVVRNGRTGIRLQGTAYCLMKDNVVLDNSQEGDNLYDGILLDEINTNYAKNNWLSENFVYSTGTPRHRYCIAETSANEDYNIIFNNRVLGAGTGAIRKQGANTVVKRNLGWVTESSGVLTASGDGVATEFDISSHGLAENPADPSRIHAEATPVSADAQVASPCEAYPVDLDADGAYEALRVKFASAPTAGTNNVKVRWKAELD